jgi:hypothetical protein
VRVETIAPPEYPNWARVYQLTGSVTVRVEVGPKGNALNAQGSGAPAVLVEAAERSALRSEFAVSRRAVFPVTATIVYDFVLVGKPSAGGLTKVQFDPPNHVRVEDQPTAEHPPLPFVRDIFSDTKERTMSLPHVNKR